nr:Arm1 [uncultured bacterium]
MSEQVDTGPTREEVRAGAAVYTHEWLSEYDAVVLDRICRRVWHCDQAEMLAMYDRNIGGRHLDLGPGTGYFLDHCRHSSPRPRIALVDLNPAVLSEAANRLRRFQPVAFERDVLSPFDLDGERFDSAGLNFLLHCLPGGMAHKAKAFDHARAHVVPGGRVFGSTVLAEGVRHSKEAYRLLDTLNENGTFDNRGDSLRGLETELASRFTDYQLTVRGSVALFTARA